MLTYIQIIHCLNNKTPIQNTENKTRYMYTENLQLLKKIWAAGKKKIKYTVVNLMPGNIIKLIFPASEENNVR